MKPIRLNLISLLDPQTVLKILITSFELDFRDHKALSTAWQVLKSRWYLMGFLNLDYTDDELIINKKQHEKIFQTIPIQCFFFLLITIHARMHLIDQKWQWRHLCFKMLDTKIRKSDFWRIMWHWRLE